MNQDAGWYIALYFAVGAFLVLIGGRGVWRSRDDSHALLFLAVGVMCWYWALIWTFGLHRQMGI